MGFEQTNILINNRIHEISQKFKDNIITDRERNELASLIYPKLRYYIWKFCKNNDDTDEALQWTLTKIFNNISKFNIEKGCFTTWIYRIARNETLYYLYMTNKHNMKAYDGFVYEPFECPEFDEFLKFEDQFQAIYDMSISEIYEIDDTLLRNIAIDKMIKQHKVKSIADRYLINENTVKTKLRKIRTDIKTRVLDKNPEFKETLNHIFDI